MTAAGPAASAAAGPAPDVITASAAVALVHAALTAVGVPDSDAADVADALVETSLRGVDTHGLRLLPQYLDELARGVAVARPDVQVRRDHGAGVLIDAGGALGVVAGLTAARIAEQRARQHGVAAVGVTNSNHFGAAAVYSRWLAQRGLVGVVTTSAAPRVAPFGGVDPLFGTNPISVAAGSGADEFALDMATSQVCFGEIKQRQAQGLPLEPGWASGRAGEPVLDPDLAHGLAPLGGYKGQGLAMVATLLGAVLTGSPPDWQLSQIGHSPDGTGRRVGHLVICLDPAAFAGVDAFAAGLSDLTAAVRAAPAAAAPENGARREPVLVPGDPQRAHAEHRCRAGIPLDPATADALHRLAADLATRADPTPTDLVVTS